MNLSFRQTFVKMIMVGNAGELHNRKQLLCNVSEYLLSVAFFCVCHSWFKWSFYLSFVSSEWDST